MEARRQIPRWLAQIRCQPWLATIAAYSGAYGISAYLVMLYGIISQNLVIIVAGVGIGLVAGLLYWHWGQWQVFEQECHDKPRFNNLDSSREVENLLRLCAHQYKELTKQAEFHSYQGNYGTNPIDLLVLGQRFYASCRYFGYEVQEAFILYCIAENDFWPAS